MNESISRLLYWPALLSVGGKMRVQVLGLNLPEPNRHSVFYIVWWTRKSNFVWFQCSRCRTESLDRLPPFLKTISHTHTRTLSHIQAHPLTHPRTFSLSLSCSFSHTPSHSHSFPLLSTPWSSGIMEPLTKICAVIFVISPIKSLCIKFESYYESYSRLCDTNGNHQSLGTK